MKIPHDLKFSVYTYMYAVYVLSELFCTCLGDVSLFRNILESGISPGTNFSGLTRHHCTPL